MRNFAPVSKGKKATIIADEWNAVREAAVIVLNDWPGDRPGVRGGLGKHFVQIQNDQPETVPAYGILVATGPVHVRESLHDQESCVAESGVEIRGGPPVEGAENEIICIIQQMTPPTWFGPCVLMGSTPAWVDVLDTGHLYARPIPDNVQMLESAESGPVRLIHEAPATGLQLLPVLLGLPATGESPINAKERFPAVIYVRETEETETYVICPGGKGVEKSTKTVHVLHVEKRKISTSLFGSMPVAMNNFGATLADNGYGDPMLVCAPGDIDEGSRYPVQRYEFSQEQWSKSDTTESLAGCPVYELEGKVIVAGGQSAYYVSNPVKTAGSTATQFYGHNVTPFWSIDPPAGTLETRVPRRLITSGTSETPESAVANQQKRFLKQNFSGVFLGRTGPKPVEFLAVGGTELLGYQANAAVTYAMDSTGPVLDCENATVRIGGEVEVFPDTPVPLGECGAVRVRKRRSGEMIVDCDLVVCIGGRYRDPDGRFLYHEKPWSLDLENVAEGWRNDLFPPVPTPRINAALSGVVTSSEEVPVLQEVMHEDGTVTREPVIDPETGEPVTETKEFDRVFLIGGRTKDGLTALIEALNLTTGEWETDWPGLDGKVPK